VRSIRFPAGAMSQAFEPQDTLCNMEQMRTWTSNCKSDNGAGDILQDNGQIMAIFDKITACI
jgi:hypothetical protein